MPSLPRSALFPLAAHCNRLPPSCCRLRLTAENPKQLRLQHHLRAFAQEAERQELERQRYIKARADALCDRVAEGRVQRVEELQQQKAYMVQWEREGLLEHAKNLSKRRAQEKSDLRLELAFQSKAARTKQIHDAAALKETVVGIDAFENVMKRVGADQTRAMDASEYVTDTRTPVDFMHSIAAKLPDPKVLNAEAEKYIKSVHAAREDEVAARRERERRRRRVLVEQQVRARARVCVSV
jgi:hypothetical protein